MADEVNPREEKKRHLERSAPTRRLVSVSERSRSDSVSRKEPQHSVRQQDQKKSGRKKILIIVLSILLLILIGTGIGLAMYVSSIDQKLQDIDESVFEVLDQPADPDEPFYTLILGSDSRDEGAQGRSDTIILARIDPSTQEVALVSIPRDTKVQLPEHGTQKINAAYAYGGLSGAVQAVSDLAQVPIAHVVEVDFSGFKDIVDTLGGVTVNVPPNTSYKGFDVPEGKQTLNGEQALVFVRCRKTYASGDYQRTDNQRQLITAIMKKTLDSSPTEIPGLAETIASSVKTDMSAASIVDLVLKMKGMNVSDVVTTVMPSHSGTEDGVSYVFVEEPAWSEMMARIDQGENPSVTEWGLRKCFLYY